MNTRFWDKTTKCIPMAWKKRKKKICFRRLWRCQTQIWWPILFRKIGGYAIFFPALIFFIFFKAICINLMNICTKGEGLKRLRSREINWYVEVYLTWNRGHFGRFFTLIQQYFTATHAAWFDHFSILKCLGDTGLNYLSFDTLVVVWRAMDPKK